MNPQKVIHVITRLDRGGSAQNTVLTALGHNRARFLPSVVAGVPGPWDAQGGIEATEANRDRLKEAGVEWRLIKPLTREVNPVKDLLALQELTALFRRQRPAIVHTHTSKAGVLGRVAARLAGVPAVVHTPHGHVFYGHFGRLLTSAFIQIERRLARRTTRMIALTEAERSDHLERGVGEANRFAVIPSGIDVERFRAWVGVRGHRPKGLHCPPDAIVVGSVGWFTPIKGHRFLIEAMARLKPSFPPLHLLLVGRGDLRHELQTQAEELGVAGSITWLEDRVDIPECLAAMDVFVFPSLNEGMGRALVEAMAAGRPVIASKVGGIPAVVRHRETGLLVSPGDARTLEAALLQILHRPIWAKELGAMASTAIGSRYSALEMVRTIESIYEEALSETAEARIHSCGAR